MTYAPASVDANSRAVAVLLFHHPSSTAHDVETSIHGNRAHAESLWLRTNLHCAAP
jgi:hypothetical protein